METRWWTSLQEVRIVRLDQDGFFYNVGNDLGVMAIPYIITGQLQTTT